MSHSLLKLPMTSTSPLPSAPALNRIVTAVDILIELQEELQAARNTYVHTAIQRQIGATRRQIDRLVYELYELTEEEIPIVEGDTLMKARFYDPCRGRLLNTIHPARDDRGYPGVEPARVSEWATPLDQRPQQNGPREGAKSSRKVLAAG